VNQFRHTQLIKELAVQHGFDFCGIAEAKELTEDAFRLEQWLAKGFHGDMQYMEKHFDLRINPKKLVPGAKSVITFLKNYSPEQEQPIGFPKIAKYAYGQDYHEVIKISLNQMLDDLRQKIGPIEGRGFVDSAPVLERAWAVKSGLGWVGKNGNLINKKKGSFFFIATLITDLELLPDQPMVQDHCGTCTKCIDACPTDAILPNKEIEANKCISYFTIELKQALLPKAIEGKSDNWIFGCDICQDVCPWNRFSHPHQEQAFSPTEGMISFTIEDWFKLDKTQFNSLFKDSPLKRAKWEGLQRNLANYTLSTIPNGKP
jgi:epoxyqueuosine reductase